MSEQERKAELEKIQRYIERTKMGKDDRYELIYQEAAALYHEAYENFTNLVSIISLVFDYGKAKGYRKAMKKGKK